MRIQSVDVRRFGRFDHLKLEFPKTSGLCVIHGPNEAGKSTLSAALRALFFGIAHKTPYVFRFGEMGYKGMALEAVIELPDSRVVKLRRTKARKDALGGEWLKGEGPVIDEAWLKGRLGGLDAKSYAALFGLGLPDLQKGAEVLKERGVAELLAGSSLGGAGDRVSVIADELEKASDRLFKANGKNPDVNALLRKMRDIDRQLSASGFEERRFNELEGRVRELSAQTERLALELETIDREIRRASRLRGVLPSFRKRERIRSELKEESELPSLSSQQVNEARELLAVGRAHEDRSRGLDADILRAEQSLKELVVDERVVEAGDLIEDLLQRRKSWRDQLRDLRDGAKSENAEVIEADLLRLQAQKDLGWLRESWPGDFDLRSHLEEVLREWRDAVQGCEELERSVQVRRRDLIALEAELEELGGGPSFEELDAALRRVEGAREIESEMLRARRLRGEALASLRAQRKELRGEMDHGGGLPAIFPAPELLARAWDEEYARRDEVSRLDERVAKFREELEGQRGEIEVLEGDGSMPDPQRVAELRERRQDVWSGLLTELREGRLPSDASLESFEAAQAEVDRSCDLLWLAAERVARRARLEESCARIENERRVAERRLAALRRRGVFLLKAREELWGGVSPVPEARAIAFAEQMTALRATALRHAESRKKEAALGRELRGVLDAVTPLVGSEVGDLAEAAARLGSLRDLARERGLRSQRQLELKARLGTQLGEVDAARAQVDALALKIQEMHGALGLGPAGELSSVAERLSGLDVLADRLRLLDQDEQRLKRASKSVAGFEAELEGLFARLGRQRSGVGGDDGLTQLHADLKSQRERKSLRSQTLVDLKRRRAERDEIAGEMRRAEARLRSLLSSEERSREELEGLVAALSLREEKRSTLRELTEELVLDRDDEAILAQADMDSLELECDALETRKKELAAQRDRATSELAAAQQERRALGGAAGVELRSELEELRARLEERAELYALFTTARVLLSRVLARFARENKPQLLGEVGRVMAGITGGRYPSVSAPLGEDTLELVDSQGQRLRPPDLSMGTREQLFLSLRLAYALGFCRKEQPLPLILDDVLVNFDEERSVETLRALAALGDSTQVLFLSCHRHLVELTRTALPEVSIVELPV